MYPGKPYLQDPWQLQPADNNPALNSGLLREAILGGFTCQYVDVNHNYVSPSSGYDPLVDIIVDLRGSPHPGPGHFVYTTDLAGNPRVTTRIIDRGAFECRALRPGTVVMFK